jgi:hypothetical protein
MGKAKVPIFQRAVSFFPPTLVPFCFCLLIATCVLQSPLEKGEPHRSYEEQLVQALEEGMEYSGSLQRRLVPTVCIAA